MAARVRTSGSRHGQRAAAAPAKTESTSLPPLAGQCLCGDFTIVISNPRPGMIMCHCQHCQVNSASFFGTYITTESRKNMMIIQSQKSKKHKPEVRVYDAQPVDAPHRCPRTFCGGCGTMLFAEPSSIGVLVVNCGIFQNHKFHPAMKPSLEIFTTRRSSWLTRREDALQADAMPVFPKPEDDAEAEVTGRRNSRATEAEWDRGDVNADVDVDVDDVDDVEYDDDEEYPYFSDGEDHLGLPKSGGGYSKKMSGGETLRSEATIPPSLEAQGAALTDETVLVGIGGGLGTPPAVEGRWLATPPGRQRFTPPRKVSPPRRPNMTPPRRGGTRLTPPETKGRRRPAPNLESRGDYPESPVMEEILGIERAKGPILEGPSPSGSIAGAYSGEDRPVGKGSRGSSGSRRYQRQPDMSPTVPTPSSPIGGGGRMENEKRVGGKGREGGSG